MTTYRPCHNCAQDRGQCATLSAVKRGLAGLGVTSVKFRCSNRAPIYRAGDRVTVSWPVSDSDGYYDDSTLGSWPATVIREAGPRFLIAVDDVASDHDTPARDYIKSDTLYCKVSAGKLQPLDEAKRSVCALCGIVADKGFDGCWQRGSSRHSLCLAAAISRALPGGEGK